MTFGETAPRLQVQLLPVSNQADSMAPKASVLNKNGLELRGY